MMGRSIRKCFGSNVTREVMDCIGLELEPKLLNSELVFLNNEAQTTAQPGKNSQNSHSSSQYLA